MLFKSHIEFKELHNSFLVATLLKKADQRDFSIECETPNDNITNNLGLVSGLYIYTNTPPHGYGSQGSKVAETVIRAYEYNKKKENKVIEIDSYKIERLNWEIGDGDFPYDTTHGNFVSRDVKGMVVRFLKENVSSIDLCVNIVMQRVLNSNADVLTKGGQTLNSFTQSVTATVAYKRMYDFYQKNFNCGTLTCLEWIRYLFLSLSKQSLEVLSTHESKWQVERYDRQLKMRVKREKKRVKLVDKTINQADVRSYMMDFARSFASYLKHKERGKLNRRAIASANVVLRMFLYIIEEFHLTLGKQIQGSTISVGGEEKKAKIINNLGDTSVSISSSILEIQGTEDATKWNECLSPAAFGIMHKTFFDGKIRTELGLPAVSEFGIVFREVALSGHFIMAIVMYQHIV